MKNLLIVIGDAESELATRICVPYAGAWIFTAIACAAAGTFHIQKHVRYRTYRDAAPSLRGCLTFDETVATTSQVAPDVEAAVVRYSLLPLPVGLFLGILSTWQTRLNLPIKGAR